MSGTEGPFKRPDQSQMGLQEGSSVRGLVTAPDGVTYGIEKVECCLKKWDAKPDGSEWTTQEMDDGTALAAGALAEVLKTEDGAIVEHWIRGESEHGPPIG